MQLKSSFVAALMVLVAAIPGSAQAPAQTPTQTPAPSTGQTPAQGPATPPAGTPTSPAPGAPTTPAPGAATTPALAPTASRTFTAPAGLLFNTVRPDRVADFERVIGYLQAALEHSSDATDRAQAQGWHIFKAAEPGPNNTVLYVFVIDPTVPSADYGLGRILADAYPDTKELQEIWRLYTGAVTSGGTLLNLTPVRGPAPGTTAPAGAPRTPATTQPPATTPPPVTTPERPLPPDADPNRQPLTPGQP